MSLSHVVVDGSNIATEGRSAPSLRQLDEAIRQFQDEFPGVEVIVVVDATFGHRIDPSERQIFDEAVAHGELVSPPAGAIGRGDAFVLRVAERVGAQVLSNDSFQEFHAEHPWLFEEGRLMGGKPIPGVGWIFTLRLPVRGPRSRAATSPGNGRRRVSVSEEYVPAVPKTPPPSRGPSKEAAEAIALATAESTLPSPAKATKAVKAPKAAKAVKTTKAAKDAKGTTVKATMEPAKAAKAAKAVKAVKATKTAKAAKTTKVAKEPAAKVAKAAKEPAKKTRAATSVASIRAAAATKEPAKASRSTKAAGATKKVARATKKAGTTKRAGTATATEVAVVDEESTATDATGSTSSRRRRRGRGTAAAAVSAAIAAASNEALAPETTVSAPAIEDRPRRGRATATEKTAAKSTAAKSTATKSAAAVATKSGAAGPRRAAAAALAPTAVNDPLTFLTFVAEHPLGSTVVGTVSSFVSHGAMVDVDGMSCYLPLTGLGDPPPRRAREVVERGEKRDFVLVALDPPRRGAELALPGVERAPVVETAELARAPSRRGRRSSRAGS